MKQKINIIISVKCVVQGGQVNVNSINYSTRYQKVHWKYCFYTNIIKLNWSKKMLKQFVAI